MQPEILLNMPSPKMNSLFSESSTAYFPSHPMLSAIIRWAFLIFSPIIAFLSCDGKRPLSFSAIATDASLFIGLLTARETTHSVKSLSWSLVATSGVKRSLKSLSGIFSYRRVLNHSIKVGKLLSALSKTFSKLVSNGESSEGLAFSFMWCPLPIIPNFAGGIFLQVPSGLIQLVNPSSSAQFLETHLGHQ